MTTRISSRQREALIASVSGDYADPNHRGHGVILRGSLKKDGPRSLTEIGLVRLRHLGMVDAWRCALGGNDVTSVRLNPHGIAQAIHLRDNPGLSVIEPGPEPFPARAVPA